MAPARRKGSGRAAAAAAAARQQWKVGDLVLAKMKGFPAWPAVVTDPKKWGYTSDRKKLLVFFFGTKQIAFCNHFDIEAFTEERKKTLLTKRQGKGADFVRAVEEIVDCYEKLQEQNHVSVTSNSGDDGSVSDSANLEGSDCKILMCSKGSGLPTHACLAHDCMQDNDDFNPDKNSGAPNGSDDHGNLDADINHLAEKMSIIDQLRQTPFTATTSLVNISRNAHSQACFIQKKAPSLRRSRCSTRGDPSKLQRSEMTVRKVHPVVVPVNISIENNIEKVEFAERNGLPNNVLDYSVCNDFDNHMSTDQLISDGLHEDVGPGITVESKGTLFHRDGVFESKDEHCMMEPIASNNKIDGQADHQNARLVLKNTRTLNKGQIAESTPTCGGTDEINSQPGISKTISSPLYSCNNVNERIANADGDKHLPLVKRARARKGELSLEEKQSDVEIKPENLGADNCDKDKLCFPKNDHTVMDVQKAVNISSNNCNKSKGSDLLSKSQSFHLREITVDAEAALPPSKRLHRALEAMSANAAEGREDVIEDPAIPEISNECLELSEAVTLDTTKGITRMPEEQNEQNISETVVNLSPKSLSHTVTEPQEPPREIVSDTIAGSFNRSSQHEVEYRKITTIDKSPMCSASDEIIKTDDIVQVTQLHLACSDNHVNEEAALYASEKSLLIMGGESEMLQQKEYCFDDTTKNQCSSLHADKMEGEDRSFLPHVPKKKIEYCSALLQNDSSLNPVPGCSISNVASGSIKCSSSHDKEKKEDSGMKQSAIEIKQLHTQKDLPFSPDSPPMKALIAAAQAKRYYSCSSSLSDGVIDTKPASDAMSSLSPFHPEDSSEHLSGYCKKTNYEFSGNRSPDVNLHKKSSMYQSLVNGSRLESLSVHEHKNSNVLFGSTEASSILQSFEALVCTLTRAKESISRATHYAIECAKHDVASEAVDVLVRNLEREPSLHRKVDMFFLVDSITRFYRGQKGVAADIYPSLFHSVMGRLISAAAPPGNAASENRRQCLKVLRLWLERKILPEPVLHHYIRAIECNEVSFNNGFSRRPSRAERALDDPVREMEGMLVDEYGSNTSFQLPGLLDAHTCEDTGGSDSDDKSFEAVTPDHDPKINGDTGLTKNSITEKHKHILEDVDGELEMEDVAPPPEIEVNSSCVAVEVDTRHASRHQFQQHRLSFAPPLPEDRPPTPPPLPSSPPPTIRPCHSPSTLLSLPTTSNKPTVSHSYISTNNLQTRLAHRNTRPIEQNIKSVSSDAALYYSSGCKDLPNHMLPPSSSLGSSGTFRSNACSRLSMNQGIANLTSCSESSSKSFLLRPPPPTVSDQFSYVQSERQQKQVHSWGKCSSSHSDKLFQVGQGQEVANLYCDGRGVVQNESCGFSATVPSGHIYPENIDTSSGSLPFYGSHAETSPLLNQCWSHRPRPPNYQYPVPPSRPPENHLSRMNGAPAYWRPR